MLAAIIVKISPIPKKHQQLFFDVCVFSKGFHTDLPKGGQGQIDFKVGSIKNFSFFHVPIIYHLITRDHPSNQSTPLFIIKKKKKKKENGRMNKIQRNLLFSYPSFVSFLSSFFLCYATSYVGKIDHWDGKHSWPTVV